MEVLPFEIAMQYKWLCYRASEAATCVRNGERRESVCAVLAGCLHGICLDRCDLPALSCEDRNLLQQIAWMALPALWDHAAQERYLDLCGQFKQSGSFTPSLQKCLMDMALSCAEWFSCVRLRPPSSDGVPEWKALVRFISASWRCYWNHPPWRGTNLGGWLLLEPGPSSCLWDHVKGLKVAGALEGEDNAEERCEHVGDHRNVDDKEAEEDYREDGDHTGVHSDADCEDDSVDAIEDEHGLTECLGSRSEAIIDAYRKDWLSERDFAWLTERGFNAVRVPFGYWIVTGATHDDSYVGPALQYLDQVVNFCERFNFQLVLDLHGNPGGESAEAPCGCKWVDWTEECWRREESLQVLQIVAQRYAHKRCVAGLQVANEPAQSCQMGPLCDWYERAIETIRGAGMSAERVAIVLPVYWYDRLEEFVRIWLPRGNFVRFDNIALDLHLYQCFGDGWQFLDHNEHLRVVQQHGRVLQSLPGVVVGEWSLARPAQVLATEEMDQEFAKAQLCAYEAASHGWFFWTYKDQCEHWDLGSCFDHGWFRHGQLQRERDTDSDDVGSQHDIMPRSEAPGPFPACYGQHLFSKLPNKKKQGNNLDAAHVKDLHRRAAGMAEVTGTSQREAVEALMACDGDNDETMARLLLLASSKQLAEMFTCSRDMALDALKCVGGDIERAACHLAAELSAVENTADRCRGRKRERTED